MLLRLDTKSFLETVRSTQRRFVFQQKDDEEFARLKRIEHRSMTEKLCEYNKTDDYFDNAAKLFNLTTQWLDQDP